MTTKMTNKTAITYVLEHCDIPDDVREKLEAMRSSLERKSSGSANRKPTARQIENDHLREVVLGFLEANPDDAFTCTGLIKAIPELNGMGTQRVAPLVNTLAGDGYVTKKSVKGQPVYQYGVVDEVEGE